MREGFTHAAQIAVHDIVSEHGVAEAEVGGGAERHMWYDQPIGLAPGLVHNDDVSKVVRTRNLNQMTHNLVTLGGRNVGEED